MWDPEQLAEIPVLADRLQAAGDPLGEWVAIRMRLDAPELPDGERQALRKRGRCLREELGSRLVLAEDPRLGGPYAMRVVGLLADVGFDEVTPDRLAALLVRPDAPFLLRLRLRGDATDLRNCVELLLESPSRSSLRHLILELDDNSAYELPNFHREFESRAAVIGARLTSLCSLIVEDQRIALPFDPTPLESPGPWSADYRLTIGRALTSPDPELRCRGLARLREHGMIGNQLRTDLLELLENDPDPKVRKAAFAVVPYLGIKARAVIGLAIDSAHDDDHPLVIEWREAAKRWWCTSF